MLDRLPPALRAERRREQQRRWQRTYRARTRFERMTVTVEIDRRIVDLLVRNGWLPARDVDSRSEIASAIGRMLAEASCK